MFGLQGANDYIDASLQRRRKRTWMKGSASDHASDEISVSLAALDKLTALLRGLSSEMSQGLSEMCEYPFQVTVYARAGNGASLLGDEDDKARFQWSHYQVDHNGDDGKSVVVVMPIQAATSCPIASSC